MGFNINIPAMGCSMESPHSFDAKMIHQDKRGTISESSGTGSPASQFKVSTGNHLIGKGS
jgi:hypothetical protein